MKSKNNLSKSTQKIVCIKVLALYCMYAQYIHYLSSSQTVWLSLCVGMYFFYILQAFPLSLWCVFLSFPFYFISIFSFHRVQHYFQEDGVLPQVKNVPVFDPSLIWCNAFCSFYENTFNYIYELVQTLYFVDVVATFVCLVSKFKTDYSCVHACTYFIGMRYKNLINFLYILGRRIRYPAESNGSNRAKEKPVLLN